MRRDMGESIDSGLAKTQENKARWLGIPIDLRGKKILELCSGHTDASLKEIVESRGGFYVSLDRYKKAKGQHVVADVFRDLPFKDNIFDYVIANGPPTFGRSISETDHLLGRTYNVDDSLFDMLAVGCNSLKTEPGSFFAISSGSLSETDVVYIRENIDKQIPGISDQFDIHFDKTDRPLSNRKGYFVLGEYSYSLKLTRK